MPFLLPALASAISDILILYFCLHGGHKASENEQLSHPFIYKVSYLAPFAIVRLCLLLFPLPYHSYTGTAIKYTILYHAFYYGTILIVLGHMVGIIMLDPDSLAATPTENMRRIWFVLTFTLGSVLMHFVLLWHVRSTAQNQTLDWRRRKHILYYYGQRQAAASSSSSSSDHHRQHPLPLHQQQQRPNNGGFGYEQNDNDRYNDTQNDLEDSDPLLMPRFEAGAGARAAAPHDPSYHHRQPGMKTTTTTTNSSAVRRAPQHILLEHMRCLPDNYDDFMEELNLRVQKARQEWTERLEDFQLRFQNNQQRSSFHAGNPASGPFHHLLESLTPFRVLLELFAFEDVLKNHRIDHVWDVDDGMGLSFYVPQLLSFLLHGAFDVAPALEMWILDKCRKNVHFAHKCFWFLRAWCLETGGSPSGSRRHRQQQKGRSTGTNSSKHNNNNNNNASSSGGLPVEENSSYGNGMSRSNSHGSWTGYATGDSANDLGGGSTHDSIDAKGQSHHKRSSSQGSLHLAISEVETRTSKSKYLPEERSAMEALLLRVMECGEIPATALHFRDGEEEDCTLSGRQLPPQTDSQTDSAASTSRIDDDDDDDDDDTEQGFYTLEEGVVVGNEGIDVGDRRRSRGVMSSSLVANAAESGMVPIDPNTGYPSVSHMEALSAPEKMGLLPAMNNNNEKGAESVNCHEGGFFLKTPHFLDSLMQMADNLMLVPREERTAALRRELTDREIEYLPANAVYMPVSNIHHRTWRIVPEESIAISTKERVPCIICLEVVDYPPKRNPPRRRGLLELIQNKDDETHGCEDQESHNRATNNSSGNGASGAGNNGNGGNMSRSPSSPLNLLSSSATSASSAPPERLSERDIVSAWRNAPRHPHRHISLLDKVTSFTSEGLKKLRENQNDIFSSANLGEHGWKDWVRYVNHNPNNGGGNASASVPPLSDRATSTAIGDAAIPPPPPPVASSIAPMSSPTPDENEGRKTSAGTPEAAREKMGQWSSPAVGGAATSSSNLSPSSFYKRATAQQRWNERKRFGGVPAMVDEEAAAAETMEALIGIRNTMERFHDSLHDDETGSGSESQMAASTSAYGSTKVDQSGGAGAGAALVPLKPSSATARTPPVVFKESWASKQERIRSKSAYGSHPGWRLLPILIKSNDDLRQEQMASQIIYRMASILAKERVPVWLCPYDILALTNNGGIIEAVPDTISIDSLRRNYPSFTSLSQFFAEHFEGDDLEDAKANFVESLAAYSIVCFLLQLKDRHNGNILLDIRGHLIHIDFGFFFLSSPGKNSGFESAPFKLTREFVDVMDGPDSKTFRTFRELCCKTFLSLRKNCFEITLLVEMLASGNEDLPCFRGRPHDAVRDLRERFRLDLNDRACVDYVNALVDESLENWRTRWYDRYQRFCVGVL